MEQPATAAALRDLEASAISSGTQGAVIMVKRATTHMMWLLSVGTPTLAVIGVTREVLFGSPFASTTSKEAARGPTAAASFIRTRRMHVNVATQGPAMGG